MMRRFDERTADTGSHHTVAIRVPAADLHAWLLVVGELARFDRGGLLLVAGDLALQRVAALVHQEKEAGRGDAGGDSG